MRQRGFSLTELLTALAIIGLFASLSVPAFLSYQRQSAVRAATAEIRTMFHLARSRAIARQRNAGLRFTTSGVQWQYTICDDGNGDGIRNDDLSKGIDRCIDVPRPVLRESRFATIGVPGDTIKDPDGDALLPTSVPVQFGNSRICSFSPLGESTSGTIYLTNRNGDVYAVRVYGATAKIRMLRYDRGSAKWVSR
jgi:prepilin-type N-terminal cleavage/methylation domain-containing protein